MVSHPQIETENQKAFVTVFNDVAAAQRMIGSLQEAGFAPDQIELVTHSVVDESPEIETPRDHETTVTSVVQNSLKWSGAGAGLGAVLSIVILMLMPAPTVTISFGIVLALMVAGALPGLYYGMVAGVEHAAEDDSVNLPELDEYESLVQDGHALVVVLGDHDQVMLAKQIMDRKPDVHYNIRPLYGHEHHEHPARKKAK